MLIYDINADGTAIAITGRQAPVDPMTGEPKIPGDATTSVPPVAGKREIARFVKGAWQLVPDWRGYVYWLADGTRHEIDEIGIEPPDKALDAEPPASITDLATTRRTEIEASLDDALGAGMNYSMPDGTVDRVQMLAEDRQNLLGLAIEARDLKAAGETGAVQEFRGLSNTRYPMTPDEVIALTDAALGHYKTLKARSWDRKDAIDVALTAGNREGIEAVVW